MSEFHSKRTAANGAPTSVNEVSIDDRRGAARCTVAADAEVVELASGAQLPARVCDLSPQGCYLDMLNPFPVETLLRVRLFKGKQVFELPARVCNSRPGLGMGVAFAGLTPDQKAALEDWLAELKAPSELPSKEPLPPGTLRPAPAPDHVFLARLVQLLVKKRILTEMEAAEVLHESFL